jgi:homoserine dehydrogenase
MADRYARAHGAGRVLAYVGTWSREHDAAAGTVGIEALAADDPLLAGSGCDNRVVLRSTRYDTQPLVISGPGAGAEVTAAALVDDVLRVARRTIRAGDPARSLAPAV